MDGQRTKEDCVIKRFGIYIAVLIILGAIGYKIYGETVKRTYHMNGQIYTDQHYDFLPFLLGKRDGLRRSYYANGQLAEEYRLKDDKPHGPTKVWHESGKLRSEATFVDGKHQGEVRVYYENGNLFAIHQVRDGRKHGLNQWFYPDGTLKSYEMYKDDLQHGTGKFYYEDGTLKEESEFVNNKAHGPSKRYHPNGQLAQTRTFRQGKLEGLQTYYREDGTLWSKLERKSGEKHGHAEYYYPDGILKQEGSYQDGKMHGTMTWYEPTGTIDTKQEYVDGERHGWDYNYRWNGTLSSKYHYENGKKNGLAETYYRSGELNHRLHYRNGNAHGPYKLFNKNGDLLLDLVMASGRISEVNAINIDERSIRDQLSDWGKSSSFETIIEGLFATGRYELLEYAGNYIYNDPSHRHEHYENFIDELGSGFWDFNVNEAAEEFLASLDEWKVAYPDSILPDLVKIDALIVQAWSYRGKGYADSVTKGSFQRFHEKLVEAEQLVKRVLERHPDNVDVYVRWILIAMGLNYNDAATRGIFDLGQKVDPHYPRLYRQMATTLLPRWGGRPGELERFMRESTIDLDEHHRYLMRAQILLSVIDYVGFNDYLKNFNFTKEETFKYLDFYLSQAPHKYGVANKYGWFAYHHRDRERARRAFELIGDRPVLKTWDEAETFLEARDWALDDVTPPGPRDIHKAISMGDLVDVYLYLKNGGDVNIKNSAGETLLHTAVQNREWKLADLILDSDPKLDIKDADRYLPIHHAVIHKSYSTVRKLIEKGSPVDAYSLQQAAQKGSVPIAELLLKEDPSLLNKTGSNKWTALHHACRYGQTRFVQYLNEQEDLDWGVKTDYGDQCLHLVTHKGAVETAIYLLSNGYADPTVANEAGETPLDIARKAGEQEMVEILEAAIARKKREESYATGETGAPDPGSSGESPRTP